MIWFILAGITAWSFIVYVIIRFVQGGAVSDHIERGRYTRGMK